MKLEDQLVSLELSLKLNELGFKQESNWYWVEFEPHVWDLFYKCPNHELWFDPRKESLFYLDVFRIHSAYSVAELGEMLPNFMASKPRQSDSTFQIWNVISPNESVIKSDSEADVRAKMLIYLRERKLI